MKVRLEGVRNKLEVRMYRKQGDQYTESSAENGREQEGLRESTNKAEKQHSK
jgi:hypothetical protein